MSLSLRRLGLLRLLSGEVLAQGLHLPQAFCPAFLNRLFGTRDRQRPRWDIFGYDSSGADISPIADLDRRDQRGIRTDEGTFTNIGAMFGDTVIVAGNGARADIGALAHARVADIGEMIGLGARLDRGFFYLNEIADVHVLAKLRAWAEPRERTDTHTLANVRTL